MHGASFDSTKTPLQQLLKDIGGGSIQLPDFQRNWVWDDARISSLLASISVSFPIGAIMTLETGGETQFRPRLVEGAAPKDGVDPGVLLLDGQQRMTSLYQSLMTADPVQTRDAQSKQVERHYYIDMELALSDAVERDAWIVSVPGDKVVRGLRDIRLDLSTEEKEFEQCMFPVNKMFDFLDWRNRFFSYWDFDKEKVALESRFEQQLVSSFTLYNVPVISLKKETPKEAVCLVFEKVNTGGVTLTVFELLTATMAADNFQLRDDWQRREQKLESEFEVLGDLQSDEFLQVVTLLSTYAEANEGESGAIGCRRRDILALTKDRYQVFADLAQDGFELAAKFLHQEMIYHWKDVPYRSQIVPLAAILATLKSEAASHAAREKIRRWYWNGVLGEMYGGSTETTFARDLPEVVAWVRRDAQVPSTVRDANFQASRLRTLRTRNSAAYKGFYALSMQRGGCNDFLTGQPVSVTNYFDDAIDIHHIFPQNWCLRRGIARRDFNSIINKTALSARTNRRLGGWAPSTYCRTAIAEEFPSMEERQKIYDSHLINGELLEQDDFWGFYQDRARRLLQMISQAMGKPITMDDEAFAPNAPVEPYAEEAER